MALGKKRPVLEPRRLSLAHHPEHVFLEGFQIANQDALKLGARVGILGHLSYLFEGQSQVALEDFLAKRRWASEETVGELFHLPNAERVAAHGANERVDVSGFHSVHAHELAHQVHVGIDREGTCQEGLAHRGTHLRHKPKAHTDPRLASFECFGDFAHAHCASLFELINEAGLLQKAERFSVGDPQKVRDGGDFIRA